jgi:copper resistance protein D
MLHPLLRTLHYALLLGLFGLTLFPLIGLRGVDHAKRWPGILAMAIAAPLVSAALMLVGIAAMMGQPVTALDWSTIEAMVLSTSIGWAFLLRLGMLIAAALLLRFSPIAAALLFALALVTLPWSGHAAASEGLLGLVHRVNDALHLLAAGLWLGAIGWFALLTAKARHRPSSARPLLTAMHCFAPTGIALVAIVSLTGLVNAHLIFGLDKTAGMLATPYGQLLLLKIVLVGLMLLCAARHASKVRLRVLAGEAAVPNDTAMLTALRTSLALELALALGVVATVAIVGMLPAMD